MFMLPVYNNNHYDMNDTSYGLAGAYPGVLATFGPGVRALYVPENPGV